jgi:Protein of unknown function (DUF1573)
VWFRPSSVRGFQVKVLYAAKVKEDFCHKEIKMKTTRLLFSLMFVLFVAANISNAQAVISANGDTIYIPGGTLIGLEHAGLLETTINGDTLANGLRKNPNRVYALFEGQYYVQQNALDIINPTGTLTIVGVPSASGHTKPVWMMMGIGGPILINGNSCNRVYGSLKFQNIHYVAQQLDGTLQNENFMCGTQNKLPQSLTIDNCLFEFCNIDIFDCTNESGAIGGWPYGAKFRITNSYFRNLFYNSQWWGSRILQCRHPIDTLWVENVTTTGGGLTFLQQNQLTDFAYFNHNTIVNNHKYWILSPYYKTLIVTNNIFLNQNWVGEDSTVMSSGQDPDKQLLSTINLDTVTWNNRVTVQPKYNVGNESTYSSDLALNKLKVFISNNIDYWNPLLLEYYTNAGNITGDGTNGYVNSWLDWGSGFQLPQRINNMPGQWMNSRTQALFAAYAPPIGGLVAEAPLAVSPGSPTIDNIDAATRDIMMMWNQNMYYDPHFPTSPDALHSKMVFGDFDPTTIPGYKTENGAGITKFTDLTENWDATVMSTIDGLPLGALIWNDARLAAYNSSTDYALINTAYRAGGGGVGSPKMTPNSKNINIGTAKIGQGKDTAITITNTGNIDLVISLIASNNPSFTARPVVLTIAAGASSKDTIHFAPTVAGSEVGKIFILSNAPSSPDTVTITGLGAYYGEMTPNSKNINIGTVKIGQVKDTAITITNTGNIDLAISLIASNNPSFTASPAVLTIAAGASSKDTIRFAPTLAGSAVGKIFVLSNAPSSPDTITMTGFGATYGMTLNSKNIIMGTVNTGQMKDAAITISNTGNTNLVISSIVSDNPSFTARPLALTIAAGASSKDTIRFAPATAGTINGKIFITSNAPSSPDTITMTGFGATYGMTLSSKNVDMGTVKMGQVKDTVMTIYNIGNSNLEISNIISSNPLFFVKYPSLRIFPGVSAADTIYFAPVTIGSSEGKIIIVSNAPSSPDTIEFSANVILTGVKDLAEVPTEYALSQNYPNPFNPSTSIQYGLPARSSVRLVIYNVLGQVVGELVNTEQQAGIQSVVWNATISSGLYFYRLEAISLDNSGKRFVQTRKMLLLR